jgi:hypothetical protein
VYDACWDVGVAALGTWRMFEYAAGITQGTIGVPQSGRDTNDGQQLVGRLGVVPATGLRVTGSAARGPYLARAVLPFLPAGADLVDFNQTAFGLAVDWSWGHVAINAEAFHNEFESPWIAEDLGTNAWYAEAEYSFAAGATIAARFDRVLFDEIAVIDEDSGETERIGWDRDLQRIEAAIGYRFSRDVLVRYDVQLWDEDGESWRTTSSVNAPQAIVTF